MRREGIPIASDQTGYYYAQTAGEVYSTIRNLKKMRSEKVVCRFLECSKKRWRERNMAAFYFQVCKIISGNFNISYLIVIIFPVLVIILSVGSCRNQYIKF